MSADGREALRAALAAHGGMIADAVRASQPAAVETEADGADGHAARAAAGPRTAAASSEYALLIEMIREGSRLHYGGARVVGADADLGLLLGDQLYALGLQRLAAIGDVPAVRELADVISLVAQAHAEAAPERAEAAWEAGAAAIGWGTTGELEAAKRAARTGAPDAVDALRQAARDRD